jgi:hypothetical protein
MRHRNTPRQPVFLTSRRSHVVFAVLSGGGCLDGRAAIVLRGVLTLLYAGSLGLSLAACGGAGSTPKQSAMSRAIAEGERLVAVSRDLGPVDRDDYAVLEAGRPASAAEMADISAWVKHYYAIAVSGNGSRACSMLFVAAARSLVEEKGVLPALRGHTCPAVMSKLLKLRHTWLVSALGSLEIVRVRIARVEARVVMRVAASNKARELDLRRVGGVWQTRQAIDVPMP